MTVDHVAIVGGGIGGLATATELRDRGYDGRITLVDAGEFPYDRPPLSKDYLRGTRSFEDLALQTPEWYDIQNITLRNRTTATAVRPDLGTVELGDGSLLVADRVVIATGGEAARPPLKGADLPGVHVLRSADDADSLRQTLLPGARILIVGAGLVGAEAASTAHQLGAQVTLVDPLPRPLSGVIGDETAGWLHSVHAEKGVRTLQAGIGGFAKTTDGIAADIQGNTEVFDAIVLGVGMTPNISLASSAGLVVDRGIVVDSGQTTSNPHVLAVGDPTRRTTNGTIGRRAEHWEAAQHDGARAAATILGIEPPSETSPWFWTDRHGLHVEGVGTMADATSAVTRGSIGELPFSVFGLRSGYVVAAVAVNDSNAVRAARRLIDRRVFVDPASLANPAKDLRKLLRGDVPTTGTRPRTPISPRGLI